MTVVSVIVPVHNTQDYVERCLNSLARQSHRALDIVLVNDGSTDESGIICDEWARRDCRIRVIHQEASGVSAARNKGLEIMNGEYVCFVDSDDWLREDHVQSLLLLARTSGADVAVNQFRTHDGSTNSPAEEDPPYRSAVIDPLHALRLFVGPDALLWTVAWGKLFQASLWSGVEFPVGRLHEDEFTTYRIVARASRVALSNQPTYFYFRRPGSITNAPLSAQQFFDIRDALEGRASAFEQLSLHAEALEIRRSLLRRTMRPDVLEAVADRHSTRIEWKAGARRSSMALMRRDPSFSTRIGCGVTYVSPRLTSHLWAWFRKGEKS